MENKKIKVIDKQVSSKKEACLSFFNEKNEFKIKVTFNNETKNFIAVNYFKAFLDFRTWLYERYRLFPLCKGSLLNVFPSRMSIQMSEGTKAYFLTLGKQAQIEDIVDIFDPVFEEEINNLSTVEAQFSFYKKWLKSLQRT